MQTAYFTLSGLVFLAIKRCLPLDALRAFEAMGSRLPHDLTTALDSLVRSTATSLAMAARTAQQKQRQHQSPSDRLHLESAAELFKEWGPLQHCNNPHYRSHTRIDLAARGAHSSDANSVFGTRCAGMYDSSLRETTGNSGATLVCRDQIT